LLPDVSTGIASGSRKFGGNNPLHRSETRHMPSNLFRQITSKRLVLPLLILSVVLVLWFFGVHEQISLSNIIMHREQLIGYATSNLLLALAIYMVGYAFLVAISFPGASLLTMASGFLFGGIAAGIATVFAATAGAALIFLVARSSFGEILTRQTGPFMQKMANGFNRDAFSFLLFLRLAPIFPFWAINIVPALLNMRLSSFVTATFIGIIPGTMAYAFIGSGLGAVIEAHEIANPGCAAAGTCEIDPAQLVSPQILVALFVLALMSIVPVIVRNWRRTR
jgi:uncharacterized membrane protein YdjX (TVP38/TMEM64 family)